MDLASKIAIVTGAGSGLGRAGALALARAGATVVVSDIDEAKGNETVAQIAGRGLRHDEHSSQRHQPGLCRHSDERDHLAERRNEQAFAKGHATGLQTPEEIADLVVFLSSDESRSLTGAVLNCDRGWTAF